MIAASVSRAWPRHPDGRVKMVCELSPAEFGLQQCKVIEEILASTPAAMRQVAFESARARRVIRAGAVTVMVLRNAMMAAARKGKA